MRLIDLSHSLTSGIPTWSAKNDFSCSIELSHKKDGLETCSYSLEGGMGTHLDAPYHFYQHGASIDELSLNNLIAPGYCINIEEKAAKDSAYQLTKEDILAFEKEHQTISSESIVIVNTGWHKHWHSPEKYRNTNTKSVMCFPTVEEKAAQLLLERKILGVGIDTLSPDSPNSGFPCHKTLLGGGVYIAENLTNTSLLPSHNFTIALLPLSIKNAPESPMRGVAIL